MSSLQSRPEGTSPSHCDVGAQAANAFNCGKYAECISQLKSLSGQVSEAAEKRIAFNIAVAEFYQSGKRDVAIFREKIWKLAGLIWPSADTTESGESTDSGGVSSNPALFYSCALTLYKARQYAQARRLLERLVADKDKIVDAILVCHSLLLLMEVFLCCRMPDKAVALSDRIFPHFQGKPPELTDLLKKLTLRAHLMNKRRFILHSNGQSIDWLFLKAHQLYVNGDLQGAVVTLNQYRQYRDPSSPNPDDIWAALNNNLGVIYSALRKPNISVKYIQQALKEHLKFSSEQEGETNVAKDRPFYVFNLGISLLKANRPEDAFECLVEATRHYPNNPRIWYRLAECCVMHYEKSDRRENVVKKIGSGPHAKLIPGHNRDRYVISGESYAIPTLTLEFAALCLMNATTLLPYREPTVEGVFQAAPCSIMNCAQYADLRNSVLLLYSYVSLRLNDPTTTLEYCTKLLCHPGTPTQCVLAHLYSAEALISQDRITEAMEHLNFKIMQTFTVKMSAASQDIVTFAVWLNSVVCNIVRGDLGTAHNILQQFNSPRALPLQLYLEICAGNIDNCRVLLRKFTRVPS